MALNEAKKAMLSELKTELNTALQNKDYCGMSEIYDEIRRLEMDWKDGGASA